MAKVRHRRSDGHGGRTFGSVPRCLRPQIPGGIYHLTCRGVRRTAIFRSPEEHRHFLSLFEIVARSLGWTCFSYCLMPNHYHLLVLTPKPDISLGMHRLNLRYARWFNEGYGYVGHVFEARFGAKLVESEEHLLELARYITLNPVRAHLCAHPSEWPWSSYSAMIGRTPAPRWLDVSLWVELFGSLADAGRAQLSLDRFIEDGLLEDRARRAVARTWYRTRPDGTGGVTG